MNNNLGNWVGLLAVVCWLMPATALAAELEVKWNELSPLVVGHNVKIVLPDGCIVAGEATAIREDVLAMDIQKSSNFKDHPLGMTKIPSSSITTIQVTENRGSGGRILGTIVGLVLGMVAGGEIVAHTDALDNEGPAVGTFTAVTVGATVGGYFAGKSSDQRTRIIRIVP